MGSSRKNRVPASTAPASMSRPSHSRESSTQKQKRPRIMSGLHPSQDVIGGMTLPWETSTPVTTEPPPSSRYTTRGTLNGFQRGIYDNKYHPMDEVTRPTASAKREQRLRAQTTESEGEPIALSSGSGSDVEDADADEEEGPIVPSRRITSTQRSKRTRRSDAAKRPLYNTKKHPIDDLLSDNITVNPPRPTKKRIARMSSGTVHADTPQVVTPESATAGGRTIASMADNRVPPPQFPEESPSSMQETIQRAMAVVKEASLLIPLFPEIEAHLQRSRSPIQVYEDRGVVHRTKPNSAVLHLGDFEKENIRNVSPASDVVDSSLDDVAMVVHSTSGDLHGYEDEEAEYGLVLRQPSEDIDQPRHESSSHHMPPPRPLSLPLAPSSAAQRSRGLFQHSSQQLLTYSQIQRLQEPPSTGNTPHQSQVENDEPHSKTFTNSRTVLADDNDNGPQEQTTEDNGMNDFIDYQEILEGPQNDIQSFQVTNPSSGGDMPQERTIVDTHMTFSQSEAQRNQQIGTQIPETYEYSDDATSEIGLQHSEEL